MPFDLDTWRLQTQRLIEAFSHDPGSAIAQAGANTMRSFLLATPVPPIVSAYATDPASVIQTIIDAAGGKGAHFIASLAQRHYDVSNVIAAAVKDGQRPNLAPLYEEIATKLDVVTMAKQALEQAGQGVALARLSAELQQAGSGQFANTTFHIEQSGGVNLGIGNRVGQIGEIVGGNKVLSGNSARDGEPEVLDTGPAHRQHLLDAHTQRLRILEMHVARSGYSTPPEILTELDAIRAQIAQLQREQA